jgi:hypothetical protein
MKGIWPLYSSLQIISVYLIYLLKVPSNVIVMSEQYNKIINMEFVPKEQIFTFLFKKNPDLLAIIMKKENSSLSSYATKSLGLGNPNMTVNVCLVVSTVFIITICIVSIIILIRFGVRKYPKLKGYLMTLKYMLMFNSILRSLLQTYLQMTINTFLAFKLRKRGENKRNDLVTVLTLFLLVAFPIFIFFFLKRMANWRAGFNLVDQFYLFCRSRKERREYEKNKLL